MGAPSPIERAEALVSGFGHAGPARMPAGVGLSKQNGALTLGSGSPGRVWCARGTRLSAASRERGVRET